MDPQLDMKILQNLYILGLIYGRQGNLVKAETTFKQHRQGLERELKVDEDQLLSALYHLGHTYYRQHKLIEAEPILKRVLALWERKSKPDDDRVLHTCQTLGQTYLVHGKERAETEAMLK